MKRALKYAQKLDASEPFRLADHDPESSKGIDKDDAAAETAKLGAEMDELLELLFAAGRKSLLVVLQGMDTSGKDGTIRHLLAHSSAQSVRVCSFKAPTPLELAHDFLWRVHAVCPPRGSIAIFNRSHYEDVLVVRVHELVPEAVWRRRYERIVAFERLLADAGTIVVKLFLHISKKEQEERLLAREADPVKSWKLAVGDWKERELWPRYQAAYADAIAKTSCPEAPWYVVPADRKWYRNLVVTEAIVAALRPHREEWMAYLRALGETSRAEIAAFHAAAVTAAGRRKRAAPR